MNNAKKMVLVPQEIAQQFSHSPHSTQQPTYQGLDNLDTQMQAILRREDIPLDQKAKLYQQALLGYITLHQKLNQPIAVTVQDVPNLQSHEPEPQTSLRWEEGVIEGVSKSLKGKTKRLVRLIQTEGGSVLSFNAKGELVKNGETLPGTHALDLIKDAISRSRAGQPRPLGWREFALALSHLNPPRDLIMNGASWEMMHPELQEEDIEKVRSTPSPKRSSKGKNKREKASWGWISQYPD